MLHPNAKIIVRAGDIAAIIDLLMNTTLSGPNIKLVGNSIAIAEGILATAQRYEEPKQEEPEDEADAEPDEEDETESPEEIEEEENATD